MEFIDELRNIADVAKEAKILHNQKLQQQLSYVIEEIMASCRAEAAEGSYVHVIFLGTYHYLMPTVKDHRATLMNKFEFLGLKASVGEKPDVMILNWARPRGGDNE